MSAEYLARLQCQAEGCCYGRSWGIAPHCCDGCPSHTPKCLRMRTSCEDVVVLQGSREGRVWRFGAFFHLRSDSGVAQDYHAFAAHPDRWSQGEKDRQHGCGEEDIACSELDENCEPRRPFPDFGSLVCREDRSQFLRSPDPVDALADLVANSGPVPKMLWKHTPPGGAGECPSGTLQNCATGTHLGVAEDGRLSTTVEPNGWVWEVLPLGSRGGVLTCGLRGNHLQGSPHRLPGEWLTEEAKRRFIAEGYLHLEGVVPEAVVDSALKHVNAHLFRADPVLFKSPVLLDVLYCSPAWGIVSELLGEAEPQRGCQIAATPPNLRYSEEGLPEEVPSRRWHIDGYERPGNHSPFTLLCGVALSGLSGPNQGNLVVWPGSHVAMHEAIATRFREAPSERFFPGERPEVGPSKQLVTKKGDVVLLHQKLCHAGGTNAAPHIRYQLYYRIAAAKHQGRVHSGETVDDMWCEFPALKPLL